MSDELGELTERADEAQHDPVVRRVSLTMALIAVLVATVGLLSHRSHTEAILKQSEASDRWSYMQAKNIRMHTYSLFADLLAMAPPAGADAGKREEKRESYTKQSERYRDEAKEIEKEARSLEQERDHAEHRADRLDGGEMFLEIAMVLASLTLMTRRQVYWMVALALAVAGVVVAVSGFI